MRTSLFALTLLMLGSAVPVRHSGRRSVPLSAPTVTPIKHLVVIYDENISFDHYFGTYPVASNPSSEPRFTPRKDTPHVNGLHGALLMHNPNLAAANGAGASNPFRLDRTQAATSDQGHAYTAEQQAYDDGRLDLFPRYTGHAGSGGTGAFDTKGLVMGYFDGNTVTALWNYAQHFAMSDNSYGNQYGPSTPGAIDLVTGQTNGAKMVVGSGRGIVIADGQGGFTLIGDGDPGGDVCSRPTKQVSLTGRNVGDLLNAGGVTWGWFQGGFDLTHTNADGSTGCHRMTHSAITETDEVDYVPHHEPFQYYASTANPQHLRPTSVESIGTANDGGANHQYDIDDFYAVVRAGHMPAVSFLKPPAYENGHAGNSDPLDEQRFVTNVINFLQQQPAWDSTAVILAYDDSDGWYDHQMASIGNASFDSAADQISGPGRCGIRGHTPQLGGVATDKPVNGRCGPGTRQPFLVISPWARANYVDHTQTTQVSVTRFIEDNWLHGARLGGGSSDATAGRITGLFNFGGPPHHDRLYLDPDSGTVVSTPPSLRP